MRMRISLKLLLVIFIVGVAFTTLSYWTKCGDSKLGIPKDVQWRSYRQGSSFSANIYHLEAKNAEHGEEDSAAAADGAEHVRLRGGLRALDEIECLINEEYTVMCRQDGGEVYVPFSFLHKYFEVYGRVVKHNGYERFEWQHSYSKVYFPKRKYDPQGIFLWFENYNVEVRDRVKCISGVEGVPVSTQWDTRGHFYPIQIAQFGLSHFSKNITESLSSIVVLEDGDTTFHGHWKFPKDGSPAAMLKRIKDETMGSSVLEFISPGVDPSSGIVLAIEEDLEETTFSCDIKLLSNTSISVVLESISDHVLYTVHYVMSDLVLSATDTDVFYGLGMHTRWRKVARDLIIDLQKGLTPLQSRRKTPKPSNLRIRSIILRGSGRVDNLTVSSSAHMSHFFAAADWLVRHQDDKGGWPIMVTRKLSNGMLELAPGWYSAMAQGQAMSLLTRAFRVTGDLTYLESALRAIRLFKVRSENHGVMTSFLGKYVWYEEYPTVPSSFVLNGFIYALVGLYDVHVSCSHEDCRTSGHLFREGMTSLQKMLPLFDTGSGSIYDLRHFSLGVAPNLARWDYHTTHINQLLFLSTIHDDPTLRTTANRWIGYMKGKRASHN